jgi:hypothetical protein
MKLNIFLINPLLLMPPSFLLMIFSPQKVKNMVTSIPILAPVVASIKADNARSSSPLKTTMVSFSFSAICYPIKVISAMNFSPAMRAYLTLPRERLSALVTVEYSYPAGLTIGKGCLHYLHITVGT